MPHDRCFAILRKKEKRKMREAEKRKESEKLERERGRRKIRKKRGRGNLNFNSVVLNLRLLRFNREDIHFIRLWTIRKIRIVYSIIILRFTQDRPGRMCS